MADKKTLTTTIQMRRDTAANWKTKNPVLAAGEFGYDTTNKKTKIGDGATAWNDLISFAMGAHIPPSFATADWETIAALAEQGIANKYFAVGDEKTITLSTGEEITLVILGFNHDDLSTGGKAAITIGMKNLLATKYAMNSSNTNAGGWKNSVMRTSTMSTIFSQLPSDLQAAIKTVNKLASAGEKSTTINTSQDKLFLFSEVEINNTTAATYCNEGSQYEYWKTVKDGTNATDRIKYLSNGNGSAYSWWLRSPNTGSSYIFRYVSSDGSVSNGTATYTSGVCFGFCI